MHAIKSLYKLLCKAYDKHKIKRIDRLSPKNTFIISKKSLFQVMQMRFVGGTLGSEHFPQ